MKRNTREPPRLTQLSFQLQSRGTGCGFAAWLSGIIGLLGIAVSIALAKGWL